MRYPFNCANDFSPDSSKYLEKSARNDILQSNLGFSYFPDSFLMVQKAFTLIEIMIAITIASLLLSGTAMVAADVIESIASAKAKQETYQSLTEAVARLNSVRNSYPTFTIISGSGGYDSIVFTNSGQTAGVLVGIVAAAKDTPNFMKLDPVSEYGNYGEKVLAIQDLGSSQVTGILSSTETIYSIQFQEDSLFRKLHTERLRATSYNSGTLIDILFGLYPVPHPELEWKPRSLYPEGFSMLNLVL